LAGAVATDGTIFTLHRLAFGPGLAMSCWNSAARILTRVRPAPLRPRPRGRPSGASPSCYSLAEMACLFYIRNMTSVAY